MLKKVLFPERASWAELIKRPVQQFETIEEQIKTVFDQVRQNGDKALLELTARFDKVNLNSLLVTPEELNAAANQIPQELQAAIRQAHNNITAFHESQLESLNPIETMPGVRCWRKSV
ncbi:MAG: histidinol dehydrogenase, partial [Bacteroidota bacterium]|nr:histidinol dehydrogenase [Bacteroidota bacterium]